MLLVELLLIVKKKLSELAEILCAFMIWDFMNPHKISAHSDNKQKSFIPKKIFGMLVFDKLKNLIF